MELAIIAVGLACALIAARPRWTSNHLAHFVERLFRF